MTLREAILKSNIAQVYRLLNKIDIGQDGGNNPSVANTANQYRPVVEELLSAPLTKPYSKLWLIRKVKDPWSKASYVNVCLLNPKYVAPKEGLKPWGCTRINRIPPKGYYDANADKHNQTFAVGWTSWKKLIDTPIVNETRYKLERVVAEILWELTFYGWTESDTKQRGIKLEEKLNTSLKEIEDGNCIRIPSKSKDSFEIVIPDSVSKQLLNIKLPKK